jgi:hypothetical protein
MFYWTQSCGYYIVSFHPFGRFHLCTLQGLGLSQLVHADSLSHSLKFQILAWLCTGHGMTFPGNTEGELVIYFALWVFSVCRKW